MLPHRARRGGRFRGAMVVVVGWALFSTSSMAQRPPEILSVADLDSTIVLDIRYAGADNFVGQRIDGYEEALCLLSRPAARALAAANAALAEQGYRLVAFDCYRPQRAVDHFVRWSRYPLDQHTKSIYYPHVPKDSLFAQGYIASRSGHSRASTVDVGLVKVCDTGSSTQSVDMGTPFDFFDPLSHTRSERISKSQRENRMILLRAMRDAGFRNYSKEWWHFTLIGEPYPDTYFDVPVRRPSR